MQLIHKEIPDEFLKNLPHGIKYIRREGKDYLVIEKLFCPEGHNLMVDHVRLHDQPSIKLSLKVGEHTGPVYVDAFWGSHDKLYSFIPSQTELSGNLPDAHCPECDHSLMVEHGPCKECGNTRFIELLLPGVSNKVMVCSKLGCPGHELLAEDLPMDITESISEINFFGW